MRQHSTIYNNAELKKCGEGKMRRTYVETIAVQLKINTKRRIDRYSLPPTSILLDLYYYGSG